MTTFVAFLMVLGANVLAIDDDASNKIEIAIMDLRAPSLPKELVVTLSSAVAQELDRMGTFRAIGKQDIEQMLAFEKMKDTLGCDSVSCLAEIGGALGVDYLVSGSVTQLGETFLIQMQLMNIKNARVEKRTEREYAGGPKGLLDEVRTAARFVVQEILKSQSGRLVLTISEEGASVKIDGRIVGVSPLSPFTVAGGIHTLAVEKQGFVVFQKDIHIQAQQDNSLNVSLRPSSEFIRKYKEDASFTRTMAWTALGVGGGLLATGAGLFVLSKGKASDLDKDVKAYNDSPSKTTAEYDKIKDQQKSIGTLDALTLTAFGVGLVSAGIGTWLYLSGDDPDKYDATTDVSVSVIPGQDGFAFVFGGNF